MVTHDSLFPSPSSTAALQMLFKILFPTHLLQLFAQSEMLSFAPEIFSSIQTQSMSSSEEHTSCSTSENHCLPFFVFPQFFRYTAVSLCSILTIPIAYSHDCHHYWTINSFRTGAWSLVCCPTSLSPVFRIFELGGGTMKSCYIALLKAFLSLFPFTFLQGRDVFFKKVGGWGIMSAIKNKVVLNEVYIIASLCI